MLLGSSAAFAASPAPSRGSLPPLILISIDGFRADYFYRGDSPTLSMLASNGVRAEAMRPSFPTVTFPNHYALVTGLYPNNNGIVYNSMYVPKLGRFSIGGKTMHDPRWWDEAVPIWVTADKDGLKTATMFWPGSAVKFHGHQPDYWLPYDGHVAADERVDQVLKWLDLPSAERPDFITLYFSAVDSAGHRYGPNTPQVDNAITHVDNALARLVDGLKTRHLFKHANIIIVSDHGMASTPRGQNVLMNQIIDLQHVRVVSLGVLAGFIPKPGYAKTVAAKLLEPHPHMRCWRKADFPARLHYGSNSRIPPLNCLANVGWQITTRYHLDHLKYSMALGEHGYDNASPLMGALFIAHGPAFRKDIVVPEFPNVDVYPLMTHLLGIKPRPNNGSFKAVKGMLKPSGR